MRLAFPLNETSLRSREAKWNTLDKDIGLLEESNDPQIRSYKVAISGIFMAPLTCGQDCRVKSYHQQHR